MRKASLQNSLFCVMVVLFTFLCSADTPRERKARKVAYRNNNTPTSFSHKVEPLDIVEVVVTEDVNLAAVRLEDQERERWGGPYRFAVRKPAQVDITTGGTWEQIDSETWMWRLHVVSPGATSLSLGFTVYNMPPGGKLFIYSVDGKEVLGPYTERDNALHGQLWTPLIYSDEAVVELTIPLAEVDNLGLTLGAINHGYRRIPSAPPIDKGLGDSDWCEIDVNCSYGDGWRDQIRSVAWYYLTLADGTWICTGALINNTAQDNKLYFLTAFHCFDEYEDGYLANPSGAAASMVVTWNFQATTCGGAISEPTQDQSGAYFRAGYCPSDFVLVELDETPSCVARVYYAGWDRNSSAPSSGVAIHHPQGDLKKISIEYDPLSISSYTSLPCTSINYHLLVSDWDVGTTEGGSSGCPLFGPQKRIVGQLTGGKGVNVCDHPRYDYFGRFYTSWTGGGTSATRLSNWLDPLDTGALTLDGKNLVCRPCDDCEPEDADLGTIGTAVWDYNISGNCGNWGKWVGQFTGEAGAKYHFDLCPSSPGSGTNSGFDPDIKITNSSCNILAGEDGSCTSPIYSPNNFQWICPANGTYYVIIAPYNSYSSYVCKGTANNIFTMNYYKESSCSITVTSPDGGQWMPGNNLPITWTSGSYSGNIMIELYKGGSLERVVEASLTNSGSYDWPIPSDCSLVDGDDYQIKVTAVSEPSCFDISNNFGITLENITVQLDLSSLWTYQSLPGQTNCGITAEAAVINDPAGNSGYTYHWEFELPSDVTVEPVTVSGGGTADASWTFAAPGCNEPAGLSDSGQTFKVRVQVVGNNYGNSGTAEREFAIALLGDVDNDGKVNADDRSMVNLFWKTRSAGPYTFKDCDIDCNGEVDSDDRSMVNLIWKKAIPGVRNSVSNPCPLR